MKHGHTGHSVGRVNSRAVHSVGRVGALAVLLGVGVAITGLPAVASADTNTGADTSVSAGTTDRAPAPRRQARGDSADAPDPTSTNSAEATSGPDSSNSKPRRPGRVSTNPGSAANTAGSAAVERIGQSHRESTFSLDPSVPETFAPRASTDSIVVTEDSVSAVDGGSDTPTVAAADSQIEPAVEASPAPAAPVMTAASRGAVSGAGRNLLTWLGGGTDPLAPIAAPFAWATLAMTRREFSGTVRTAAPAAVVTTSEPVAVTDSPLAALLGQSDAQAAIFTAAKQFVLTVVAGGNGATALQAGLLSLDANPLFSNYAWDSVLADPGMAQAIGGTVSSLITGLAADAEVQAAVGDQINGYITSALGNNAIAATLGSTVADAVVGLLADPAAGAGLGAVAGTAVTTLLSQPGAVAAMVNVNAQIGALVGGSNPGGAADAAWQSLQADPAFQDAVGLAVTAAVTAGLTNTGLVQALGTAVTEIVADVRGEPALQAFAGDQIAGYLSDALAGTPAAGIAGDLTDVVVGLISNPAVGAALAGVAGSALTDFLGQPGIATAVAEIAGQAATAVLAGTDSEVVLAVAWQALQADSAFNPAVAATVANAVTALLSDAGLVSALGATTAALVTEVTADPAVWAFVTELAGSTYGDPIVAALTDLAASGGLADLASSVVTGFLGAPGVVAALSDTASQVTTALLNGTSATDALQGALASLQADPAIGAAVDAVTAGALQGILGESAVQEAVSAVAKDAIESLINGSGDSPVLAPVVGAVTEAVVDSLLANAAMQEFISDLALDLAGGAPIDDIANIVIQAVIDQPALQFAVGAAVGAVAGALVGDNPVGFVVGQVVGAAATVIIGLAAVVASVFNLFEVAQPAAAAGGDSYLIEQGRVLALLG